MAYRALPKFNPQAEFAVAGRPLRFAGLDFQPGDAFPKQLAIHGTRVRQMFERRMIVPVATATASTETPAITPKGEKHGSRKK